LPKAHVESSNFGSIILAGIILKLGGYGAIIFINFYLRRYLTFEISKFFFISRAILIFFCLFLNDIKIVIAYFSISHIRMVVLRIFINYFNNLNFCIIIIISHSISSSILFIFNHIFYENFSSRIINKISSIFNFLTFTP